MAVFIFSVLEVNPEAKGTVYIQNGKIWYPGSFNYTEEEGLFQEGLSEAKTHRQRVAETGPFHGARYRWQWSGLFQHVQGSLVQ